MTTYTHSRQAPTSQLTAAIASALNFHHRAATANTPLAATLPSAGQLPKHAEVLHRTAVCIERGTAMEVARSQAALLTPTERTRVLGPLRDSVHRLATGRGTLLCWQHAVTACHVATAIHDQGVVRDSGGHLPRIEATLTSIGQRGGWFGRPPAWKPPALRYTEADDLRLLADLYAVQLQHLSYGEYQRAYNLAAGRVVSAGGLALAVPDDDGGNA